METDATRSEGISVVIPCYNSALWIEKTIDDLLPNLEITLQNRFNFEILVVDDGSTDDTAKIVTSLGESRVRLLQQPNKGRFGARLAGAKNASYSQLFFVDSRIFISKGSIEFLVDQIDSNPLETWVADASVIDTGLPYGSFWRIIETFFWRDYYRFRANTRITNTNFDRVPKGTGALFIDRELFISACEIMSQSGPITRSTNDDTRLLRTICEASETRISPDFSCVYYARSNWKSIMGHIMHRGAVLIDGHLRTESRFFPAIAGYLVALPMFIFGVISLPRHFVPLSGLIFFVACSLLLRGQKARRIEKLFFVLFLPFFIVLYTVGMIHGLSLRLKRLGAQ